MASPTHLKALQALEAAVRNGSLREAAEELGITPAAAGQRIKALEDYLGVLLLERGRSGLAPAQELKEALPYLHRAFADLAAAARELDVQRSSEIHIAAPSDFVELWLEPRLAAFRATHPNTLFCINGAGDVPMRLGRTDCEFAVAPAAPDDPLADTLFHDFVVPICSPANSARVAGLAEAERLEGFPLLHLDMYKDDPAGLSWPKWIDRNRVTRTAPDRGMRFQRLADALLAVNAHAGVCLGGLALIADRLAGDEIVLPYPVATGSWSQHAFVARFRADTHARRHIARFRDWLSEQGAQTRDQLAVLTTGAR